jgi:hypothetical protein
MGLLIAFDPGATSGVCVGQHISGKSFKIVNSLEITWPDRFKIFNLLYANRTTITAIVIEEFRLFANKTTLNSQINSEMPSSRVIGIIELSAALCKLDCLHFQTPAQRKNVNVSPEHAPQLMRSRHTIDAYLHLKYFVLCNHRKLNNGKSK